MNNKRHYTTSGKTRQPWPGEAVPNFEPPINESLDLARQIKAEVIRLAAELAQTRQRVAELETALRLTQDAGRAVVAARWPAELGAAIKELGRVLGEVESPRGRRSALMSEYPMFQEIINEMKARPEADPVGILEENISPLLDVCNKINLWIGTHQTFDFTNEPPWYEEFMVELARFDVDLTPVWSGSDWANGWVEL
jgi:hypothetical protein